MSGVVDAIVGESGLEVGSLGVLALALVCVLVAPSGLGGREIPAAVVALELACAVPLLRAAAFLCLFSHVRLGRIRLRRRTRTRTRFIVVVTMIVVDDSSSSCSCSCSCVLGRAEFNAKEAYALLSNGRRAYEGELGEGVHTHEVVGLLLKSLHGGIG